MLLKLAWRNLRRNRRRSFLTMAMMVFAYVLFSLFICISDGMYGRVIDQFIHEYTGHGQIHKIGYLDSPKMFNTMPFDGDALPVEGLLAPRLYGGALLSVGENNIGAEVVGVSPEFESNVTTLKARVSKGEYLSSGSANSIIIGDTIAEVLKVDLGGEVILISSGADGSIANDIFNVVGIIESEGKSRDDYRVYMTLPVAQEFFSLYGQIHEWAFLNPKQESVDKLLQSIEGTEYSPWEVVEKDFYKAMQADQQGDTVGRMIFIIVAALGVLNTVLMSLMERKREFGVLIALGTRPNFLTSLILVEVVVMAVLSSAIGVVIATAVNYYFTTYGIQLATPLEYGGMRIDAVRGEMLLRTYTHPLLIVLFSSIGVAFYPALSARNISPVEAMRSF